MWANEGLVFEVSAQEAWSDNWSYAQAPQLVYWKGQHRIYFASRRIDEDGQWVSEPFFVEVRTLRPVKLGSPKGPLLSGAPLGAFDEHGVFPFSPVVVGDEVWAFTTGWQRRVSVPVETAIGVVMSRDGSNFSRLGPGPVLTRSTNEPFLVCDGFVRQFESGFLMWYSFGTDWLPETPTSGVERVYKIGVAVSPDGIAWTPAGGRQILEERLGPLECQALPTVVNWRGRLLMSYCYRSAHDFRTNPEASYRIGFAESANGFDWQILSGIEWEVPRSDFDRDMQAYPGLSIVDGQLLLLYNGNEFGRHGFGCARWSD